MKYGMLEIKKHFPYTVTIDLGLSIDSEFFDSINNWLITNLGEANAGRTYIGPIQEESSIILYHYSFVNKEDAVAFKLTWQKPRRTRLIIDPPSGWRYGFPREIPRSELHRANEWMVEHGYPQKEVDDFEGNVPYSLIEE